MTGVSFGWMAALWVGLWLVSGTARAQVAPEDVAPFTRYAEFESVSISPQGTYLAVTQRKDELERLIVLDRATLKPKFATHFGDKISISDIVWASESYLLVQPARRVPGITDFNAPTGEIGTINIETGRAELIFGYRAGRPQTGSHVQRTQSIKAGAQVLDVLPDEPFHVLIQTLLPGTVGGHNELLKMDIRNGRTTRVARSPVRNGRFAPDRSRARTLVAGQNQEGQYEVHLRERGSSEFERVFVADLLQGQRSPLTPAGEDGFYLFSDADMTRTRGVIAWNPRDDRVREVFRHDDVDYRSSMRTPQHELYGITYYDHYPRYAYPDPEHPLAISHARLVETFPDMHVQIVSMTDDHRTGVVYVSGPTHAGAYLIVDLQEVSFQTKLDARSWLDKTPLADMIPLEFVARDGVPIRALLTLPEGKQTNLPMVVMVHGGPHGIYDRWGFNWRAQMFAQQGFAVLQVNYRGSGGQGLQFQAKGYGRWGREMQDDVTDAVQFVVQQGTAHAKRICIFGASYGAYSALSGAFRDPDLYRCAVGLAGVYDLELLFERGDIRRTLRGVNYLQAAVGDDKADLESRSPVHNADKIKIPVMLIHGELDIRAPVKHAQRMRAALRKAKNRPVWHVEKREGHGIASEENRAEIYAKVVNFVQQHTAP